MEFLVDRARERAELRVCLPNTGDRKSGGLDAIAVGIARYLIGL
jgi:hypothetical protein